MEINLKNSDVHQYDGKLKNLYLELVLFDNENLSNNLSFDASINEIINDAQKIKSETIKKKVVEIIKILGKENSGNHDTTNNITLESLLPRVWRFYRDSSDNEKMIFYEQIYDMRTGMCPQGRAGARLYQLYEMWMHYLKLYKEDKLTDPQHKDIVDIFEKLKL